jgi:LytS/YehU family sensor histidine kinase
MALNLSLTFYGMFFYDSSLFYYILTGSAPEYLVLFFVQCVIVAQRYSRAQSVEISFLKGQIRPHFIHNSLTGIASTIRNDPARTRELLVDMSSYLRGFYDYDSEDLIALEKELELVRAYAGIEQMRFGYRVQLDFDIDSERLLLPALILQPLVENAFIHGLREKESGGKITVFAKRIKNGKARVGVRDNGFGFQFVRDSGDRQGVGIMNINRRLAKLYRTRLVYRVPEGGGCEVCMEIPWKEETASERVPDR